MTNASIPWAPLRASVIQRRLRAHGISAPVTVTDQTGSTQDDALAGLRAGAPHGAVYAAERQTQGRGRQGRRWLTTPGSLLFSVIVYINAPSPGSTGRLTIAAAVSIARAVQRYTGASASIKWPNDLVFGQAKAGGLLVETHGHAAVVGVGLNAYGSAGIAEGQATTTLAAYATQLFERNHLLAACVVQMLDCLSAEGAAWDAVHAEWVRRSILLGREVELTGSVATRGRVEGFETDGALRLRDAAGGLRRISSGDVSLRLVTDDKPPRP